MNQAQWHFENCETDYETEEGHIVSMWCEPHKVDVTECLPDVDWDYNRDDYTNEQENNLL